MAVVATVTRQLSAQSDNGAGISVIKQVIDSMNNLGSFKADLSINHAGTMARGKLSYQDGKIHLKLSDGRVIAADGKELVVYNPVSMVAGRQSLDEEEKSLGLNWLLSGYGTQQYDQSKSSVVMKALDSRREIQDVQLEWNEKFYIKTISYKTLEKEEWTVLTFANITSVNNLSAGLFSWRPPAESRTVLNPLNTKN